jgi:hypothetical protein
MPDVETRKRAARDRAQGKAPTTQAGEFVREEVHHVREGKHGSRSPKQTIAIGLSKARRAGVPLPPPRRGTTSARTRRSAERDVARGQSGTGATRSARRSRATTGALKRESRSTASPRAMARQARTAAAGRTKAARSGAARKASRTKGASRRSAAGKKAARTRGARQSSSRHP